MSVVQRRVNGVIQKPEKAKPARAWTDPEKVEFLLNRNWNIQRIAHKVGLAPSDVWRIRESLEEARLDAVASGPEKVKARHASILEGIAEKALDCFHRNEKDQKDPRFLKTAMQALADVRRIYGLDAPSKSMSLNLSATTTVSPAHQQAMIDDPEYRRLVLALEEREHEIAAKRDGDVAGQVHEARQPGQAVLPAPPRAPEPEDDGPGDRPDHAPGHLHAAEARQVRVPVEVLPGVVSGHLPRPEGDLGRL